MVRPIRAFGPAAAGVPRRRHPSDERPFRCGAARIEGGGMQPDFVADPGVPPPDHIPDEIIDQYANQARHTVKYRQSRRYRASLRVRKAREPLRDSELWSVTALVFFWAVAGLALTG